MEPDVIGLQVFASEQLFPRGVDGVRMLPVVDSVVDFDNRLTSIGNNPTLRVKEIAPDYAPVVATFLV